MPYPAEQPAAPHDETLFDARAFDAALRRGADPRRTFRRALAHGHEVLWREFRTDAPATELVHGRTRLVDQLIVRAWHRSVGPGATPIALVAVGGYGRGELLPRSDIDLMILLDEAGRERYREDVTTFITFLWDIGLEVGHSARTVADCVDEATRDITVATNLMEARILAGAPDLFESMRAAVGPERIWPSREFFAAKWQEQQARHHHFDDTAYNLEPNIKEGPGGLRDIHMVGWVAKRHFGATTLHDLVQHRFLTEREYHSLIEGQEFLWRIRFALHTLTDRREDRLLFDHQRTLADLFDYSDAEHALAVEQFMQRYYRTITELNRLNEMLLQLFQEAILLVDAPGEPEPINKRFQARRGFIEAASEDVFRRHPFALLEIFLHLMQRPSLKGVRATTIRLIRDHCHLIDEDFRRDLRARTLFVEILRQPGDLSAELGRMNRYGVLAAYLPVFGRVVGQMQYDLFHVYTVDEHTLTVVRNVGRFVGPESTREFPLAHEIYQRLPKPELLYLAAMFHDIAKGRGGDHSELGAQEAEVFCREHGLSRADTGLVTWLVFNHLLLSMTAQRRDVSDPEVVAAFARQVGDQRRLDYLYLLTMADIRGTNPKLWNSWRAALLLELYTETKRALRAGLEHVREEAELIRETKEQAAQRLAADGISAEAIVPLWQDFPDEYFLRHRPDEVAWHTAAIAQAGPDDPPLVLLRGQTLRGSTAIFIYARAEDHLFALVTAVLDQLGLDIVDARIISSRSGYTVDTYLVLEESGEPVAGTYRETEIRDTLRRRLRGAAGPPEPVSRRPSRQVKHFLSPTKVQFKQDARNARTAVEVYASDRPGLLSQVARAFLECDVHVQNARITTIGARTEDVFFVRDADDRPVTDPARLECVRRQIIRNLDESLPEHMRESMREDTQPRAGR